MADVSVAPAPGKIEFFREQLKGAIRHALAAAARPGAGRIYALVITAHSVETNLRMRAEYQSAVRRLDRLLRKNLARHRRQKRPGPAPDVRLVPVKSAVFAAVCEQIFGGPGRSGDGLAITGATLARALDEIHDGLADKRDIGEKHWLRRVLLMELQSPAEERLPMEG